MSSVKNDFRLVLMLIIGALAGSVLNEILRALGVAEALTQTVSIGLNPPVILDLAVLKMSFGFTLRLSFCSVLGLALGLLVYKKVL